MQAVARELKSRGYEREAERLQSCGASCAVQGCSDCGEQIAHAQVTVSCDLRICPQCSRYRARETVERMTDALLRVPGYVAARAGAHADAIAAQLAERARVRDVWSERAARARDRLEHAESAHARRAALASHERSSQLASSAADECAQLRFDLERTREAQRGGWVWKLVTISPAWTPTDARAYTPEGLQERVRDVWARWELVRERYSAAGLTASVARVEVSEGGHVHVHALVYGPWIRQQSAVVIAGCHVDVRAIDSAGKARGRRGEDRARASRAERAGWSVESELRSAIKESCKYLAKVPSVLRSEWVSGRSTRVIHPALAASWVIALRGAKAGRVYGPARDAIAAQRALDEGREHVEREPSCRCCGSFSLAPARFDATPVIARALGLAWGAVLSLRRQIPPRPGDEPRR